MKKLRFSPPIRTFTTKIGNLFKNDSDRRALDTDDNGSSLYKEDIIANVYDDLQKRKTEKMLLEQQWILNANALVGNQNCEFNIARGRIEQLEPVYDWLERETFNQIAPLIDTRVANLKKVKFLMKVNPRTNELDDWAKADVSTSALQYIQKKSNFEQKNNTAILWNEVCGNCFWINWWDTNKGEKYAVEKTVTASEDGIKEETEKVYYQGDIDYGLLTPYEIYPESIFKQTIEAQRSIIIEQVKTKDEIHDLYGIEVEGSEIETFELTPVASGGGFGYENTTITLGHRTSKDSERVITYFERPSRKHPGGRMIIIVGNDNLVYYGDMPYDKIPIVQSVAREVPGQFFGKSVIEDLIPRQKAYNGCINRIHEYIKRVAIGSYIVEEGSLIDIEEIEQNGAAPGALLVYRVGTNPPKPVPNGTLPPELMQERFNLKSDMEYAAGVSQLMVNGNAPQTNMSGAALSNLMEIDSTRLSLTGDHLRNAVKELAIIWLEILKRHASTLRIINCVGMNGIGNALVWSSEDINSFDVEFVTENELKSSEEVQKQNFFDAYNMGLFTDGEGKIPERVKQRALEYMKIGNYSEIMNINLLQLQAAQRENIFFEKGAVPEISEFDEHEIHIEEHLRYVLQMRFQVLKMKKKEYAKALEDHIKLHKKALEEEKIKKAMANTMNGLPGVM